MEDLSERNSRNIKNGSPRVQTFSDTTTKDNGSDNSGTIAEGNEVALLQRKIDDLKKEHEKALIVTAACNVIATTRRFQKVMDKVVGQYDICETLTSTDKNFLASEDAGEESIDNDLMLQHRFGEGSLRTDKLMKKNMRDTMMSGFKSLTQSPEIIVNGQTFKIAPFDNARIEAS
jgi:hypothetical protein